MTARVRGTDDDSGAAVSEFVMVATLLVLLLFAVLQVAVFFYDRTVVAASAADAARYAASADAAGGGAARASTLIEQRLGSATAADLDCSDSTGADAASGLATITVRCTGHVHAVLAPFAIPVSLTVTSSVLREHAP